MIKRLLLALLFVAGNPVVFGQSEGVAPRTLTVSGTGSVTAASDRALLHIAFESEGPTAVQAIESHEEELERVKSTLAAAGISDDAIRTERYSIHRRAGGDSGFGDDDGEKRVLTQRMVVTIDNLDLVDSLISEIVQDNEEALRELFSVNRRNVDTEYVVKDRAPYEDEALQVAIRRARMRAQLAADEAGVTIRGVAAIREMGVFGEPIRGFEEFSEVMMAAPNALLSGEQKVSASVVVMFDIE